MRIYRILPMLFFIAMSVTTINFDKVRADDTITIGEINTYSKLTSFTIPYRNGWQLALEEINNSGDFIFQIGLFFYISHFSKLKYVSRIFHNSLYQ